MSEDDEQKEEDDDTKARFTNGVIWLRVDVGANDATLPTRAKKMDIFAALMISFILMLSII